MSPGATPLPPAFEATIREFIEAGEYLCQPKAMTGPRYSDYLSDALVEARRLGEEQDREHARFRELFTPTTGDATA